MRTSPGPSPTGRSPATTRRWGSRTPQWPRPIPAGGLFVAGHYYRIPPFLVWFHRFGPVAAGRDVPQVGKLFDHRWPGAATLLLAAGTAGLIAALVTRSELRLEVVTLGLVSEVQREEDRVRVVTS